MNESRKPYREIYKESNVDIELVKQIKQVQDLPEDIIVRFIKAAGSLSSSDFEKTPKDEL
jgi:hypothetical protein